MFRCLLQLAISFAITSSVVSALAASAELEPFPCPSGTIYRKVKLEQQGVAAESCRDALGRRQGRNRFTRLSDGSVEWEGTFVDNKEDGLARSYNSEGELLSTASFSLGVPGATHYTLAGLRALAQDVNEFLVKERKPVVVQPNGDGGLTAEHNSDIPYPGRPLTLHQAQVFRSRFRPLMCALLVRNPGLQTLTVRILWSEGEIASVEKYRVQQCPGSMASSSSAASAVSREP